MPVPSEAALEIVLLLFIFFVARSVCKKMAARRKKCFERRHCVQSPGFPFRSQRKNVHGAGRVSLRDDDDDENGVVFYWGGSIQPQIACYSRAHLIVLRAEAIFRLHRSRCRAEQKREEISQMRRKNGLVGAKIVLKNHQQAMMRGWKCLCVVLRK
jgi:hypothetical protein